MVHLFMELNLEGFCLFVCFKLLLKSEFILVNGRCIHDCYYGGFFYLLFLFL